jgi:hypothetical protein
MRKPVGALLSDVALARRSPLYQWLWRNRAEIAEAFAAQSRPAWTALAGAANAAGVVDRAGQPYSRDAVRKAWQMVQRDMKRAPSRPVAPISAERQPAPLAQTTPSTSDEPRPRGRIQLRPARPLGLDELPDDDGSALPKPFSRTKQ